MRRKHLNQLSSIYLEEHSQPPSYKKRKKGWGSDKLPCKLSRADDGYVDGGDGVSEGAHREGGLEEPVLDPAVGHRPVVVPCDVHLGEGADH